MDKAKAIDVLIDNALSDIAGGDENAAELSAAVAAMQSAPRRQSFGPHIAEPWYADGMAVATCEDDMTVAICEVGNDQPQDVIEATAQRIADCVSWCAGLSPSDVPEVVAALDALLGCCELNMDDIEDSTRDDIRRAANALAEVRQSHVGLGGA